MYIAPTPESIEKYLNAHELHKVVRGEVCVFGTPAEINGDMKPTDHSELLVKGIYPLANKLGAERIALELDQALRKSVVDALGTFCAIQCYYVQINLEQTKKAPFVIDRSTLPLYLSAALREHSLGLQSMQFQDNDPPDAAFRLSRARLRIMTQMYSVEFGAQIG